MTVDPNAQTARGLARVIDLVTRGLRARLDSLVEWARVSSYSTGPGALGTATTSEGEAVKIVEPYGLASRPPGSATGLVLAPGADGAERVLIGSIAPAGRPATAAGDTVLWTAGGHSIALADDGAITITSKDGSMITLDTAGSIALDVGVGQLVTLGDVPLSDFLAKVTALESAMTALLTAGAATLPSPGAGTNGALAFTAAQQAWEIAIAATPLGTVKTKGS